MKPSERIKQIAAAMPTSRFVDPVGRLTDIVEAIGRYLDEQHEQGNGINGPTAEALCDRTNNLNERVAKLESNGEAKP